MGLPSVDSDNSTIYDLCRCASGHVIVLIRPWAAIDFLLMLLLLNDWVDGRTEPETVRYKSDQEPICDASSEVLEYPVPVK